MFKGIILNFAIISLLFLIPAAYSKLSCEINRPTCYDFCGIDLASCRNGFFDVQCKGTNVGCHFPAISCSCRDGYGDIYCSDTQILRTCNETCSNKGKICIKGCDKIEDGECSDCQSSCSDKSNYCICSPFDFSLSTDPKSGSVTQGVNKIITISTTLNSVNSRKVRFSCPYLWEGISCSFNPTNCTPPCSSTLIISTTPTALTGTYDVVIKGSGGEISRYDVYTLTVTYSGTPPMKMWINDPKGNTIVDSATLINCNTVGNEINCFYQYVTCGVTGYYTGMTQDVATGTYSSWKNLWYCNSCGNGICNTYENCLNCPEDCGCPENTACCEPGVCLYDVIDVDECKNLCNYNGTCDRGENCLCSDCYGKKDACKDDLRCTDNLCKCPPHIPIWSEYLQRCIPSPLCGNGVMDDGENCCNCPNDAGCGYRKICHCSNYDTCSDCICQNEDGGPCDNNSICDPNEVCNCKDCFEEQDRCLLGLVCKEETERCGCKLIPDGICPDDPDCKLIDPDCLMCNNNGKCESGEHQFNCPDCNTYVNVSPPRMHPGNRVNVTVYFNDSGYSSGQNAKIALYIDNVPWVACSIHNSKWEDMGWNNINNWKGKHHDSNIEIISINGYSKIKFDCIVPKNLTQGMHTLRADPSIFSEEKKLKSGETVFYSSDNRIKILNMILLSIKVIF